MTVSESTVERKLVRGVKRLGGLCLKFLSPGTAGVPDRIIVFNGRVVFVELKTDVGVLSPLQKQTIHRLRKAGAAVAVAYGTDGVDAVLSALQTGGELP